MYQLIIKNAMVIDPANGVSSVLDVALSDGKIAGVGRFDREDAQNTINAEGCIVTPGLIDHHAHLYPLARIGIPAEAVCFSSGVTTAVDAGSAGCAGFTSYLPFLEQSKLGIKAYLNVCSTGLDSLPRQMEQVDPSHYDLGAMRELFARYGSRLLGLKLRTSREIVGDQGYLPLQKTVELAEKLGVSVMVHCTNPPGPIEQLLSLLRKGDVVTHMYMNIGHTILGSDHKIQQAVYSARERGVLFEAADARAHFSFEVSEVAVREGFYPDIIATDLTMFSMHQRPTAFHLANQISKYRNLGIPLVDVIACCTSNPAKQMGLAGKIGCLSVGADADVAVFQPISGTVEFGDRPYSSPECQLRYGNERYRPLMTVKNGEIVYRNDAI